LKAEPAIAPVHIPLLPKPPEPEPSNNEPLELRVGTYWMARIGIVILLTGLVFLGNYAYHLIVPLLGPLGKVSLLLLSGLGLGTTGYIMERSKESLRNFGRVLFAGGAASIYYTTYASHFVQGMRVIESPLIGGLTLLAVAGGIAWYAERKRSETIASLAVLLSYYTSAINSIAGFTLFSSLLLTAVAIFFLVRHHWTRLSYLSLFATYGSYAFWRFCQVEYLGSTGALGMGLGFLAGYWILFTAGIFLATPAALRTIDRTSYLSLNNIAFFSYAAHHFAARQPDAFWMFAIGFGGVLLGLSALAAYRNSEPSSVDGAYLAQGLIAITAGFAAKFSGPQLSMILALECSALLACSRRRHAVLYEIGAGLSALAAFELALAQVRLGGSWPWSIGAPVAALFLFNAWWVKKLHRESPDNLVSPRSMAFTVLALILVGNVVWFATPDHWRPLVIALLPLAGLAAFRLRMAEVGLAAQLFLPFAALLTFTKFIAQDSFPWWYPAPVIAAALLLLHWWQSCRLNSLKDGLVAMQLVFAAIAAGVGVGWMRSSFHGDAWLIATSLAASGATAYGLITRAWAVSLAGQLFSALAVASFIVQLLVGHPAPSAALMPVAAIGAVSIFISRYAPNRWPALPEPTTYPKLAGYYRVAGALLFAGWSFEYVPLNWRVAFFAVGGALQIFAGSMLRSSARIVSGTLYAIAGVALFWMRLGHPMTFTDLLALLAIPLSLRISAHLTGEPALPNDLRDGLVTLVLISAWLWVTNWTLDHGVVGQLTTSWTVLALAVFAAGLTLRERVYRLGGFVILGLALGRLFLFDVWKFDSIYRIVSFIVLGAALLTLSFVYHRFSETLRKYL
jgi:uncharacterized membrane protein